MKHNIIDGWYSMEVIDAQDVLLDRYANPWDIQSGRRITHVGIYRAISDVERNPLYDKAAIQALKAFFNTDAGVIQAGQNALIVADRAKQMLDMGVPDVMNPIVGETYVELNECQQKVWDEQAQRDVVMVGSFSAKPAIAAPTIPRHPTWPHVHQTTPTAKPKTWRAASCQHFVLALLHRYTRDLAHTRPDNILRRCKLSL